MVVGDRETARVTVGVDGAETNKTLAINNNDYCVSNKETPYRVRYIALPTVTVGGPTAGLGRCLERARTVIT